MIKIIKNNIQKTQSPYYQIVLDFMIGDSDGNTTLTMKVDLDDEKILERFFRLISSLDAPEGYWGVGLNEMERYENLSESDVDFLHNVMWDDYDSKDEYNGFFDEICNHDDYSSYLSLEDQNLYYYDEFGVQHDTEIVEMVREEKLERILSK